MSDHDLLGMDPDEFDELRASLETGTHEGLEYRYLPDHRRGVEKGTVLAAGTAVRGFPKIPRTLIVETGVPGYFDGPVAIEEKLNGYNVRIARVDGDPIAFTRGGHACPYTTWFVRRELPLERVFDDRPEAMLCTEVYGPENPYTVHDYPDVDSLAVRAFDLRDRTSGEPVPVRERREFLDERGIPQTRLFGIEDPADVVDRLPAVVDELDAEGREGVVLQSADGADQLKYTTSASSRGDLAHAFTFPFEYGREFVFRRLLREAFQSHEFDSPGERRERADRLGEAILESMADTIETIDGGETVDERHTIRGAAEPIDGLLEHFRGLGLEIVVDEDRREDGQRVVTFRKRVQSTNDKIANYLEGNVVRE